MIMSGFALSLDQTCLIWWRMVGVIGRRDGPVDEAGCFAFALVTPLVTSFNFGIEECWGSGWPSDTCL